MALTPSTMLPLQTVAPNFNLPDTVSGNQVSLHDVKSDAATVIMFICNHCPFVKHLNAGLAKFANEYLEKGVSFIAISSNDVENYPDDSPEKMKALAAQEGFNFPYLYDEDQSIAKAYDAACTPDFYIFDKDLKLAYRGQFDSSRPNTDIPVTGESMRKALDEILAGKQVSVEQLPSMGCNIKWKK